MRYEALNTVDQGITAGLNYLVAGGEKPFRYISSPPPGMPQSRGEFEIRPVTIRDGRPLVDHFSLDRQGFLLLKQPTAVADLYDAAAIERDYYPEIERLVKAATGAEKVLIFDHTLRNTAVGQPGTGLREPATRIHNDYTYASAPKRVRDLLPPAEAEARLGRRYLELNVWRPIRGPVLRSPLALCDAQSVDEADLVVSELRYPDRTGETYAVTYSPRHRWFYFPRMQREEALLIKCFDSATDGRARLSVHTAFDDPTTAAGAPPRESIEVRTFAFF